MKAAAKTRDGPGEALPPEGVQALREAIVAWFREAQRPLPWREGYDPYRVWISEIMLQQTQVDTVLPYYERWMARFPDVASVAAAPQEDVLKAWEGLGYYSRARNLKRAAERIVAEHGGTVPGTVAELTALPGIGLYTAGAIASIAYGQPEPVVDGNVGRVLGRLYGLGVPVGSTEGRHRLWDWARQLVPPDAARDFNQGLMELGALVCRDRAPACLLCPVQAHCAAYAQGNPEAVPPKARRKARPVRQGVMLLLERNGHVWLRRRPGKGVWGGLWEFPWVEADGAGSAAEAVAPLLPAGLAGAGLHLAPLGRVRHGLTHFELVLDCLHAVLLDASPAPGEPAGDAGEDGEAWRWVARADLARHPQARLNHKARELWAEHRAGHDGAPAQPS